MLNILLMDDNKDFREMTTQLLHSQGHAVYAAKDGRSGLALYASLDPKPDLVITDLIMPEVEGTEVLLQLRTKVPVIAISGGLDHGHMDILRMAKLMGAGRILHKPFRPSELFAAIDELLGVDRRAALGAACG